MKVLVGRIEVPISGTWLALCLFLVSVAIAVLTRRPGLPSYNVAFVGNSMMYYNDLPRLVEKLGDGHVFQDSCLVRNENLVLRQLDRHGLNIWFSCPLTAWRRHTYDHSFVGQRYVSQVEDRRRQRQRE